MIDRTKDFKNRPDDWRIEAVIHDGSWYDIKKWARVAKVKPDYLKEWIRVNKSRYHLIKSTQGESYRVTHDEVLKWYDKQEDINITDKIIPKNYPPRLWDGKTEAEAFLDNPRRTTATVTMTIDNTQLLRKCTEALVGAARIRQDRKGKYRAYGLSDEYMIQCLKKSLTADEFLSLDIKRRKTMKHRELTDFSKEFAEKALEFYLPFARNILKTHMSTLTIYLPDENDLNSQIISWIVVAMRKFDETQPVPFSGYLSSVLRFWPYDLPDEFLGKKLSGFQRQRQKAIKSLEKEQGTGITFSNKEIAKKMDIDFDEFVELNQQHQNWINERTATTLNWSDSSNEKAGVLIGDDSAIHHNVKLANLISLAILNSIEKTNSIDDGVLLINSMEMNFDDPASLKTLNKLSDDFKKEFYHELSNLGAFNKC